MDIPNTFDVVASSANHVHIRRGLGSQILTSDDALNLAAHLVAHAEQDADEGAFESLLEAVREQTGDAADAG